METREYWLKKMIEIVEPVLVNAGKRSLRSSMNIEGYPDRERVAPLEAVARSILGIAPWLESKEEKEGIERKKWCEIARSAITAIVDPESPDYGGFNTLKNGECNNQILVEAAILSFGILRAPVELWEKFSEKTKKMIEDAMVEARKVIPVDNNWILFSAMVEGFFYKTSLDYDPVRLDVIFKRMDSWYAGDGLYKDGKNFHMDYYNSLIIHPMLMEILCLVRKESQNWEELYAIEVKRAKRYAEILEKMINTDGTYPIIGRSVCYRYGVFFHLSYMSLIDELPDSLNPPQVRCALTEVIKKVSNGSIFREEWLKIGLVGEQSSLGEFYINTGSLYFCTTIFAALGIPEKKEFWSGKGAEWSSRKIWSGMDIVNDHSLKE